MPGIKVKDNESLDNALARFKKQCAKYGVLAEIRKREHYEKPSVKRKKEIRGCQKKKTLKYNRVIFYKYIKVICIMHMTFLLTFYVISCIIFLQKILYTNILILFWRKS